MFADFSTTATQIGILLGVWSVVAFLLEVPSGEKSVLKFQTDVTLE